MNIHDLPVLGIIDVGDGDPPPWAAALADLPFSGDAQRADVAAWLAREMQRQGYNARAEGTLVHLPNAASRHVLAALVAALPALPDHVTLIGQADGITYAHTPKGDVWMCAQARWRYFCAGATWSRTATSCAVMGILKEG